MIKENNTPYFVINEALLENNAKELKRALHKLWPNHKIGYSYKTNSLPWIIKYMKNQGFYAEVVSDTEYNLAKYVGYNDNNIIFNGPNKSKECFLNALFKGSIINIDSFREVKWLKENNFDKKYNVGLRVNFNLEELCPNETAMGDEGGRFGFSIENGDFYRIVSELNKLHNIKVAGIHMHNSTKTRSLEVFKNISKKAVEISKMFNYDLDYVDIGGGFYGGLEGKPSYKDYIEVISQELSKGFDRNKTTLIIEPGASIIASPIDFICEVIDIKDTYSKRIVTTNGSRNNIDPLFRKNSYIFQIDKYIEDSRSKLKEQVLCGYTCMEDDRLMKLIDYEELRTGDNIIFKKVGSYTMCLSPLFIEYFPDVYLLNKYGEYCLLRNKWGIDEYVAKNAKID